MLDCIYNLQLDSSKVTTPTTNIVVFGAFILSFLSLILTPSTAPASRTTRRYSTASSAGPPTRPTSTTPSTCSSATTTGGRTPTSKSTARWTMNASRQVLPLTKTPQPSCFVKTNLRIQEYNLTIRVENNGAQQLASEATVFIVLEDVNDEIPLFTEGELVS